VAAREELRPTAVAAAAPREPAEPTRPAVAGGEGTLDTAERVPYGGYMELHLNHHDFEPTTLDFHRFVLLFGHRFTDRIGFVGELELEHALVEGGEESGELELEQAYLDFVLSPSWSARAGMMLVPLGVINERHEPASFHGVERPFVDTFVIPSTWFSNGAGVVGRLGRGFSLKTFLMSTLDGSQFSAAEGFRDGRQKGFIDDASNLAGALRLEYAGVSGVVAGVSLWSGNTGFQFPDLSARLDMLEIDARGALGRFDFRGEAALTELGDSAELNRAIQRRVGVNPNVAEQMRGFYLEGAFHLFPRAARRPLVAFYRFEDYDTQYEMAPGFLPLEQFDRRAHTLGLTFLPHPDVALKVDYSALDNESAVVDAADRWNLGIGWWF
jgi:hypothetical protein